MSRFRTLDGNLKFYPRAFSGALVLTAGGTAQTLFSSGEIDNGFVIANPYSASQQGIATAESIWYDITGATAVAEAGSTSMELLAGQTVSFTNGLFTALSWIAVTEGHKISGYAW